MAKTLPLWQTIVRLRKFLESRNNVLAANLDCIGTKNASGKLLGMVKKDPGVEPYAPFERSGSQFYI